MANNLEAEMVSTIVTLHNKGWSKSRIARELGIDRGAVARHIKLLAAAQNSKPAIPTIGSPLAENSKPAVLTTGSPLDENSKPSILTIGSSDGGNSKPAILTTGSPPSVPEVSPPRTRSLCEPYGDRIREKRRSGFSAQRIYQDLVEECGFSASYESVKRYVRLLEEASDPPFRRMEVEPGKEMQVDFGRGAAILDGNGRKRYPHLFRTVLSHSRKGYSEVVFRQTTEDFIRVLENAFRSYGGVSETLVVDNLKAAVIHADWYDPEINPKIRSFCEHYGTVILPTRPRTPRHKGKIERGIAFAQNNALKGRVFKSLAEQNDHLALWEERTADTRLHGTTKTQVRAAFERERPFLQPLPAMLFPCFKEARRSVHQDGHIEFEKSYYSVPPEHKGREVIVRADTRMVRIFSPDMRDLAVHIRVEPGKFSTQDRHIHREKRSEADKGSGWLVRRAHLIGPGCGRWAERVTKQRGVQSLRTIQGLLALARKHGSRSTDEACRRALDKELLHLREVRRLMGSEDDQPRFEFAQEHPLIRDMGFYGKIVSFDGNGSKEAIS